MNTATFNNEGIMKKRIKYLFFATTTAVTIFICIYLVGELVSKFYFLNKPVVYNIKSQKSINAQSWFENWDSGFGLNRAFVERTCAVIDEGLYSFEWDYKSYCEKL